MIKDWLKFVPLGIELTKEIKSASPGTLLKDFVATMKSDQFKGKIADLRSKVEIFAEKFPMPGYDDI